MLPQKLDNEVDMMCEETLLIAAALGTYISNQYSTEKIRHIDRVSGEI